MAEVTMISEKLRKYGVLGAGIVTLDPSDTLRHAQSLQRQATVDAVAGYKAAGGAGQAVAIPQKAPKVIAPAGPVGPSKELSEAIVAMAKDIREPGSGAPLKREHILEILTETARVQGIVQQEISVLARELTEAKNGKKRRKPLTFLEGHKKILELNLPREPLEDHGISESVFQNLLMQYQEDDEVMLCASKLLHPAGKGDPDRAKGINIERIVEIHQFMVKEMDKVCQEFKQLSQDVRREFTSKACETTAELLVSVAVEQQLSVRCEDVEQAVIMYDDALQQHPEFTRCTENLAYMMQMLISATQDRPAKEEFLAILKHLTECTKAAKVFAKKLYEDYRSKSCDMTQAYVRFEEFNDNQPEPPAGLPELSQVEMQLCYDEYQDDADIKKQWEQSGAEVNVAMQNMMTQAMGQSQGGGARPSAAPEEKNKKKTKPSDIVEMQELMVDELKRLGDATGVAVKKGGQREWRPELLTQMVQALASGAVERRFGISAEEMTMLGFTHAATLQRNERFVRATEKQQEILMQKIPELCAAASAS